MQHRFDQLSSFVLCRQRVLSTPVYSAPEGDAGVALELHRSRRGIAYLHVNEPDWAGGDIAFTDDFRRALRERFKGSLIFCGHYDAARTERILKEGIADAAAIGRTYIANPDLVERFRVGAEMNEPNPETYYGGGAEGYTDYPFLDNGHDRLG